MLAGAVEPGGVGAGDAAAAVWRDGGRESGPDGRRDGANALATPCGDGLFASVLGAGRRTDEAGDGSCSSGFSCFRMSDAAG